MWWWGVDRDDRLQRPVNTESARTGLSKQNLVLSTQANMAAYFRVWLLCVRLLAVSTLHMTSLFNHSQCQETSELKLETRIMWTRNSLWGGSCEPVGYLRRRSGEPVRDRSCEPETIWNIGHWSRPDRRTLGWPVYICPTKASFSCLSPVGVYCLHQTAVLERAAFTCHWTRSLIKVMG